MPTSKIEKNLEIRGDLVLPTPEIERGIRTGVLQGADIRGLFVPEESGKEGEVHTRRVSEWFGAKEPSWSTPAASHP